jgi:hypothetical protein
MPRRLRHASIAATKPFSTSARSSAVTRAVPLRRPSSLAACAVVCERAARQGVTSLTSAVSCCDPGHFVRQAAGMAALAEAVSLYPMCMSFLPWL